MEQINIGYSDLKSNNELIGKDTKDIFIELKENLDFKDATYWIGSKSMMITTRENYIFTLLEDGTVIDGRYAYLDISDGSIEINSTGYIQGELIFSPSSNKYQIEGETIAYDGDYIITGTSIENAVQVKGEKTYNITIKDLKIDVRNKEKSICAFNANRDGKETNLFVNLFLEGENHLYGCGAPGVGFSNGIPNINGIQNGSTLTISGEGYLEAVGGNFSAGIGSGYNGWDVASGLASNIIINSGNIVAKAGINGCAIGGALRSNVNNLIINGGNITAIPSNRYGIGTTGQLDNLIINGGNIYATGGEYAGAIGGDNEDSGEILITGGNVYAGYRHSNSRLYSTIGGNCKSIKIEGGTIICKSSYGTGIGNASETDNIQITGGSIIVTANNNFAIPPSDGINNVYLTEIQLENVKGKTNIIKFIADDAINYGTKDIYTTEDGKVYLYLPVGERNITIETKNKTYVGNVETKSDNSQLVILKEIN